MLFASLASVRFGNQLLLHCFSFLLLKIYQQHITRCHGFVCKVAKDSSDTAALSLKKKYGISVVHMYILESEKRDILLSSSDSICDIFHFRSFIVDLIHY